MRKTILFLAANPKDTQQLRLGEEFREIDNGLRGARNRDKFKLEQKWAVRPVDVRRAMLDNKPSIVHFSGHGAAEEGIAFEDENGRAKLVSADALAGFFELFADKVECVILNACYSKVQAKAISKHIPHVIGMNKAINDTAAINFAVAFYDALGAGESVRFAHKLACNAIQWSDRSQSLIPVLKSKAPISQLTPSKNRRGAGPERKIKRELGGLHPTRPSNYSSQMVPPSQFKRPGSKVAVSGQSSTATGNITVQQFVSSDASLPERADFFAEQIGLKNIRANRYRDEQFDTYCNVWKNLQALQLLGDNLWKNANQKNITKFARQLRTTQTIVKDRGIFFEGNDRRKLTSVLKAFGDFNLGKTELIKVRSEEDVHNGGLSAETIQEIIKENSKFKTRYEKLLEAVCVSFNKTLSS